jgi:LacI family kdg operon repressor
VVLVDRSVEGVVTDMVGLDNTEAVRMAISHLVNQGFDELLFVVQPYAQVSSRRVREAAFRDTIGALGVSGATIVLDLDNDESLPEIDARINAAQRQNRRVALFAANAPVALRVALHLKELHGADWQRRVALMSIDDSEWAELASMTTVRQPTYTIGERAVEFLHERIEGAVVAARECLLPGELVVRASTASSTNNRGT